jgi:hypothetical protein
MWPEWVTEEHTLYDLAVFYEKKLQTSSDLMKFYAGLWNYSVE